jgi:DEAD/DEAH box helicase domain-containing protein
MWQRAGRVGRSGNEGVIFFIAADTPIDSYYVEQPEELFGRETEPLAINLQNRRLLCHHLACAIDEAGDENMLKIDVLGPHAKHAMDLRRNNRLNHDVFYSGDKYSMTPIRSTDNQNYDLILDGREEPLGEIDNWHMLREAYPKAIYLHGGRRYRVVAVLQSKKQIKLIAEKTRNRTIPLVLKTVKVRRPRRVVEYDGLKILDAEILVTESLAGISEKKPDGTQGPKYEGNQNISPYRLPTEGVSVEVCQPLFSLINSGIRHGTPRAVYETITRLLGSLFPVILGPCDTQDYGAFCDFKENRAILYLYDQVHDGIELTS